MKNKNSLVSLFLTTGSIVAFVLILGNLKEPTLAPQTTSLPVLPLNQGEVSEVSKVSIPYEYELADSDEGRLGEIDDENEIEDDDEDDEDDEDDDDDNEKYSNTQPSLQKSTSTITKKPQTPQFVSPAPSGQTQPRQSTTKAS